ncbi:MAG: hypothetical protein KQJ78_25360 [Deltaproteobacteria bacterium]|nr:hypothetical protein [Deltaproteobacteria bacterium]
MDIKLDTYSFKARVLPVYLTLAPAVLLIAALLPEGLELPLGGAAAIVFLPISFFFSQIGADFGKRLEKNLWLKWGGSPTTRFLRHENNGFNEITRSRIHDKLRALGLQVPTTEEQEKDEHAADKKYEACTEDLIRRTRDAKKFPLVFKGLTEYGFRRNLFGLKKLGVLLAAVGVVVLGWSTYSMWMRTDKPPSINIVIGIIEAGLLISWLVGVTEQTVKLAADRYARFLLEAALEQE